MDRANLWRLGRGSAFVGTSNGEVGQNLRFLVVFDGLDSGFLVVFDGLKNGFCGFNQTGTFLGPTVAVEVSFKGKHWVFSKARYRMF